SGEPFGMVPITSSVAELMTSIVPETFDGTHSPPMKILSRTSMSASWLVCRLVAAAPCRDATSGPGILVLSGGDRLLARVRALWVVRSLAGDFGPNAFR